MKMRPIHRPPRPAHPGRRYPHCRWTVFIDEDDPNFQLEDLGVGHLAIIPTPYSEDASIDERCYAVERYAEEVITAYRA
jgi:hypothetical protein